MTLYDCFSFYMQIHISQSNATASVRSDVINLCSMVPAINYADVCAAIAKQYYDVHRVTDNRKVQQYTV